jgi:hypothetical protein
MMCQYHELLQSDAEAGLFASQQPTLLLSLYAPFGIPDYEPDDSRIQDRRRQAAEREEFLMDEAPGTDSPRPGLVEGDLDSNEDPVDGGLAAGDFIKP